MSTSANTSSASAPVPTDPAELERAIAEHQRALAATVDELLDRVRPANVAARTRAEATRRAHEAVYAEDGWLRTERLAAVGAAVAAVVALMVWRAAR